MKIRKSSTVLTHRAVMTIPRSSSNSQFLEFNKAQLRNWNAAKYTRRFEYSWKRFWLLTCSTRSWWIVQMIQEIWRHYWVFWEQKELRKVRAKNDCSQHLHLVLRYEQDKSLNGGKRPMFMTNHAAGVGTCTQGMTIPSYLSSEMHLQKFHDQTKFQSWIVHFRAEVYAKARNKRKGAKFLHRAGDWRMFSVADNWVFVQMETFCNYSTHACHGTPSNCVERSGRRKKISPGSSILFSAKSEGTDWRKSLKSLKASPATKAENSLSMVDKMKKIDM